MIRLFTAIGLADSVVTRLSFMQGGIPGARWSPTANLHLTLLDRVGVRLDSFMDSTGKVEDLFAA